MNLRGVKYVVRRGDGFQLRIPIPKDLHEKLGRKELRWSLRTESRRVAAQKAFRAALVFCELCDTLRRMEPLTETKINRMIQAFYATICSAYVPSSYSSHREKAAAINAQEVAADNALSDLENQRELGQYTEQTIEKARALAVSFGIDFDQVSLSRQHQILEGIVRAYVEQYRYVEHRRNSLIDSYEPADSLFAIMLEGAEPAEPGVQSIATTSQTSQVHLKSKNVPADPKYNVQELVSAFVEQGRDTGVTSHGPWKPKTSVEYQKVLGWFCEHVGSARDVRDLNIDDVRGFRDEIVQLRRHAPGSTEFKDALTKVKTDQIQPKTASKYFDFAKLFLRWLRDECYTQAVPGESLKIQVPSIPKSQQRRSFTPEELETFLLSPLFTGCAGPGRRSKAGSYKIKDDEFWLPLVLLYTGMRLNEAVSIVLKNTDPDEAKPHIRLKIEDQALKTHNAERLVPLHKDLVEIGILDFIKQRRGHPIGDRLFGKVTSHGELGNYYSKVLNRYIDKSGVDDPNVTAHSFRHYFIERGRDALLQESTIKALVGHSQSGDVTANYGSGIGLEARIHEMNRIDFKLSVETKMRLKKFGLD